MEKRSVKILSVVMSLLIFVSVITAGTVSVEAKTYNKAEKVLYNITDVAINALASGVASLMPSTNWQKAEDYKCENFMAGMKTFLKKPAENSCWNLGYSSASLLTSNVTDGYHFVAGGISVKPKYATAVIDDSRVRTIAISDGSGRGTAIFSVIDAYGLANVDVREIRGRLADYAKKNNIVSINVAVLHQHSVVDTFGMNGDIIKAVFLNPLIRLYNNLFHEDVPLHNGKNKVYQENLFNKTVDTIKSAVEDMKPGTLKFGTVNCSEYIVDKRPPYALDQNLNRFRFIPDDGSRETWFSTSVIHCVGNGVQGTEVTADYPYYMERYINENSDANFMLLLGAELSTSQNCSTLTVKSGERDYAVLGRALGERLSSVTNETVVEPLLNIKHSQVNFEIENKIMMLAATAGLFDNVAVINGDKVEVVSEIGYAEFGTNLAVALIPGELEASVAYGGGLGSSDSWKGTEWTYKSLQEIVGKDKKLLIFGLCNDQIGYIVPDNDYMAMLVPESKSVEFVSLGSKTASHLVDEFIKLVK